MKTLSNTQTETTTSKVDYAVGVPESHWLVAIVGNKTERQCEKKLERLGFECNVMFLHKRKYLNGRMVLGKL